MNKKYGFVYIWRDKKHKRYYVGCRWGNENDGYVCSSKWMKQAYGYRPHDFKRRIIKTNISTRNEMFDEEFRILKMIKESEIKPHNPHPRYYNLNIKNNRLWHSDDTNILTIGQKISKAKKGKLLGPCSAEKAKKISEAKLVSFQKRLEQTGQKMPEGHKCGRSKGYKHTEQWKIQNSERLKQQYVDGRRKSKKYS